MKILVTGGSGFIGGHLVERLIKEGHDVYIFDIDYPKYPLEGFKNTNFILGSTLMIGELLRATRTMDVVFHLAALANTSLCAESFSNAIRFNCVGTAYALEACKENNVRLFVNASSSLVSEKLFSPKEIDTPLINLNENGHIYSTSKLCSEMICKDFFNMYQLPYMNLRFGICYGPRMTPGVLVQNFITNVLDDAPMKIEGTGRQWRYYMYISDLIDGCIQALNRGIPDHTYNLVPDWKTSIYEVALTIKELIGGDIEYTQGREVDFRCKELIPSDELGWIAETSLESGLMPTIDWYQELEEFKWENYN